MPARRASHQATPTISPRKRRPGTQTMTNHNPALARPWRMEMRPPAASPKAGAGYSGARGSGCRDWPLGAPPACGGVGAQGIPGETDDRIARRLERTAYVRHLELDRPGSDDLRVVPRPDGVGSFASIVLAGR